MIVKQLIFGLGMLCALSASAQAPRAAFVISDVHDSPHRAFPFSNGGDLKGDRYNLRQSTIVDMISKAYGVDVEMVQGGPAWLEMKRFDIVAKAAPETSPADLKLMLQSVLADRFKLVMHKGEVPMPAFLVTAPGGKTKLEPAKDSEDHQDCKPGAPETAGGVPLIVLSCTGMTADEITSFMHDAANSYFTKPAVNLTGLEGRWDFTVKWTGMGNLAKAGADGIKAFDAMEKQLGLKVELKTAPRTVWIVDSVSDKPTPNSPEVAKELPEPPPAQFEVATIKPSKPDAQPNGRIANGQMNVTGMSMKFLITFAWDINPNNPDMLVNAPKWLDDTKFDVVAKMAAPELVAGKKQAATGLDDEEFRQMIRALLVERFKMQVHMDDRPIDAYNLILDHPKLKPADPKSRTHCKQGPGPDGKDPRPANPLLNMLMSCQNMTTEQMGQEFTQFAAGYIYSPVKDETGLKGSYDFTLSWSSANLTILKPPPPPGTKPEAPELDQTLTFNDALDRQLGLKLVKVKRPVPVLVIDHIDSTPTEN